MSIEPITHSEAQSVAVALGGGWHVVTDAQGHCSPYDIILTNSDGELLALERLNGRYEVSAKYSDDLASHRNWDSSESLSITVASERGPQMLAREIERRLLPAYRDALVKVRARKARNEARATRRSAALSQLQSVGQPFPSRIIRNNEVWYYLPRDDDFERPHLSVVATFDERGADEQPMPVVKLHLQDISLALAEQIIQQTFATLTRDVRVLLCPHCSVPYELSAKSLADELRRTLRCKSCHRSLYVTYVAASDTLSVREFTAEELEQMWVEGGGDLYKCYGCGYVRLEHEVPDCGACHEEGAGMGLYCVEDCYEQHWSERGHTLRL